MALIPAYKPSPGLPDFVTALLASGAFAAVVVVDDGSGPDHAAIFDALPDDDRVAVLRHVRNLGKGAALKTGLNHCALNWPRAPGVVTADADGQHAVQDVVAVGKALAAAPGSLVLGARVFQADTPLRSRLGNSLTRKLLRLTAGIDLADTQTGLRGIPLGLVPQLVLLAPRGYDFELEMLLLAKRLGTPLAEVPIRSIYIENNRSSHFNPVLDSMRIYFVLFRFAVSSLLAALVDNLAFAVCFALWPNIAGSQVAGRLVSMLFNYSLNRTAVFHSRSALGASLPRYLGLVAVSGLLSYSAIRMLHDHAGMPVIAAKILAETVIFFFNFVVQRDFVFLARENGQTGTD